MAVEPDEKPESQPLLTGATAGSAANDEQVSRSLLTQSKADALAWVTLAVMAAQVICTVVAFYFLLGTFGAILMVVIGISVREGLPSFIDEVLIFRYCAIGLLICPAITFSANVVTRWFGPTVLRLLVLPPLCGAGLLALALLVSGVARIFH